MKSLSIRTQTKAVAQYSCVHGPVCYALQAGSHV